MKKIIDFVKENYKLMIPIILMVLIFVVFFIYYSIYSRDVYKENTDKFYQYFYGSRYEYAAVVTTNRKGEVVEFKPKDIKIEFDSTPIYYKDSDKVIFPSDMSIVMPTLSCAEYLSKGYSLVTFKDGVYSLITNKYNNKLNHYFFYDSKDLYFFIENVKLSFNDSEVNLSPFSYVVYNNRNNSLVYYDKVNDKYEEFSGVNGDVVVSSEYYNIHLEGDYIDYHGSDVLLTSGIENLNTIDMKD